MLSFVLFLNQDFSNLHLLTYINYCLFSPTSRMILEELVYSLTLILIVIEGTGDRGSWLGLLVNIKEANKQAKIYVGQSLTRHAL